MSLAHFLVNLPFNTSYLTGSYIGFTLKMESVTKNTIFGLKMMNGEIPYRGERKSFMFPILDKKSLAMRECGSSGEDVSVNAVIILRNDDCIDRYILPTL